MSGFETLGGILNIVSIIDVILRHAQDYHSIQDVLEEAKARANNIKDNIQYLAPLESFGVARMKFVTDTVEDFKRIYQQLNDIQEKIANRTTARNVFTSPATLAQLKEIELRLAHKEHNIQVMGMIGQLTAEQICTRDHVSESVSKVIDELRSRSVDMQPAETVFIHVCEATSTKEVGLSRMISRNEWGWLDAMHAADKLATGIAYYEGNRCVGKDYVRAARYFHSALMSGKSEANYYLGKLYQAGNGVERCNTKAFRFFCDGARSKDPAAIAQLGQCYLFGAGVEKDVMTGIKFIQMGADGGDPIAMSIYSWQKLHGLKMDVNPSYGYSLSKKAVKKGNMRAKMNLATCYLHGLGVERDARKAVRYLKEAVEAGGFSCISVLARCYEEGVGVEVDFSRAAEIYKSGAELTANTWRRAYVQPYYGLCLIRGRGVNRDVTKGWAEIQKSIQSNNGSGWFVQGECYRHGYGVEKNVSKAFDSYIRATQSKDGVEGQVRAHYALGIMYELGEGVLQDRGKAFEHFNFGANRMYEASQWKVAVWCESGIGVEKNEVRAAHYFQLAANSGHRDSQIKAYEYYMKGKGVQRNLMKATHILRPAAESGDREAKRLLRIAQLRMFLHLRSWRSCPLQNRLSRTMKRD